MPVFIRYTDIMHITKPRVTESRTKTKASYTVRIVCLSLITFNNMLDKAVAADGVFNIKLLTRSA